MDRVLKYVADNTYHRLSDDKTAIFIWDGEAVIVRFTPKLEIKYVILSSNTERVEEQAAAYLKDLLEKEVSDLERY